MGLNEAQKFEEDWTSKCLVCGDSPCVKIYSYQGKIMSELCGPHFFGDSEMLDSDLWNERIT